MLNEDQVLIMVRMARAGMPSAIRMTECRWEDQVTSQSTTVTLLQALESALGGNSAPVIQKAIDGSMPLIKMGAPAPTLVNMAVLAHEKWLVAQAAISQLRECLDKIEGVLTENRPPKSGPKD